MPRPALHPTLHPTLRPTSHPALHPTLHPAPPTPPPTPPSTPPSTLPFAPLARRNALQQELVREGMPEDQQRAILTELEKRESDYMRLQRQRMCADDFEPLTIIGRGAFGEVGRPGRSRRGGPTLSGSRVPRSACCPPALPPSV
jgi:hypothetical protein